MTTFLTERQVEIKHFHLFCGLGGGARGFNRSTAKVGNLRGVSRCIGGIDVDRQAIADFESRAGVKGTVLDLFDLEQYTAFHGKKPPAGWREATPDDIRLAAGGETPNILFLSAPCKGFSGLLSGQRAGTAKYQALNRLTVRGIWLALEAWKDDPAEFIIFENVPRIATRGRHLLDQITTLLRHYGYAVAETFHDCGQLGNLAQRRRRFLMVARHRDKIPIYLYEPPQRPLRTVGEVLGGFPLPGDPAAGPMHEMRRLQWITWLRLAFVLAGEDWRSLERLRVVNGQLADYAIAPADAGWYGGILGVNAWNEPSATISGNATPTTGAYSVADPRLECHPEYHPLGVTPWGDHSGTVTGQSKPGSGRFSVADPRLPKPLGDYGSLGVNRWESHCGTVTSQSLPGGGAYSVADPRMSENPDRYHNQYRVIEWGGTAGTIIGATRPGSGAQGVADPRLERDPGGGRRYNNVYRVIPWNGSSCAVTGGTGPTAGGQAVADPRTGSAWKGKGKYKVAGFADQSGTVISASGTGNGAFAVADPRIEGEERHAGSLGVVGWDDHSGTIRGESLPTNGAMSVQDPRLGWDRSEGWKTGRQYGVVGWEQQSLAVTGSACLDNGPFSVADPRIELPALNEQLVAVIISLDNTWHRPFTTLELAALQGLVDPGEYLVLAGKSDSRWREAIGNAVPPPTAEAVGNEMMRSILLARAGETFILSATPVWVRPFIAAIQTEIPA
jgi:site-specific DNA-cytosine methylase